MQQLFAQDFAVGADGLAPRGLGIGQFLAFGIAADVAAFADMEVIIGAWR